MSARTLRVCALYPELMNIYADRGNLLMLERRCAWRGIDFRLTASTLGDRLRDEHDLYYIENWSFLLDLSIIGRTMVWLLRGDQNAY